MSSIFPEQPNHDGFPSGPKKRSTIRPPAELRLTHNLPRLRFFLILRKAWENLDAELCPKQPKSVSTKASDLVRNLPDWQAQVSKLFMVSNAAIDLTKEKEAYEAVLKAAQATIDNLRQLVDSNVRFDSQAESELHRLSRTVLSALIHIGGEEPVTVKSTTAIEPGNMDKAAESLKKAKSGVQ